MKIIAFFPGDYPNGSSPMSYRLHYYLKALALKGTIVKIVMPTNKLKADGIFEGIPYSYVKTTNQSRFNKLKLANEYAEICGSLSKNCDVLFTTIRDNTFLKKIISTVHKNDGKIAVELNENPYSFRTSRLDSQFSRYIKRKYFLTKLIPKLDGVIVISLALVNLVSKYKKDNTIIVKIPILSGTKEIKRSNMYSGIPYILHAGALSESKDGIKAMLEAFALAHKRLDANLKFIFTTKIGLPSLLNWINTFIKQNNLEKFIEFKGIVPKEELDELYNNCALAIVNKPSNPQNDYNFPTKLTELLPRMIPLIISKTGELGYYFEDGLNAFIIEANNVNQIAEKIIHIQNNPNKVMQLTQNGKQLAINKFYFMNQSSNLLSFFEKI